MLEKNKDNINQNKHAMKKTVKLQQGIKYMSLKYKNV